MFISPFFRRLFISNLVLLWAGIGLVGILVGLHEPVPSGLYPGLSVAAGLAVLGAAGVAYYVARRHITPVIELEDFADGLARGDLDRRLRRSPSGEMVPLANKLNAMVESLARRIGRSARENAELSAILESMGEGVIATNLRQQVLIVNEAAGRLLGFSPADAEGRNLWELIRDQHVVKAVREVTASGGRVTVTVSTTAGRKLEVTVSIFPAHAPAEGIVIVSHDVTESSRYQELRKEFVANVSHELRTPLTVIRGYVETLHDGAMHDPVLGPQYLATIQKHTDQLTNLVDDLLELSRLESQPMLPKLNPVDLAAVVRRAADLLTDAAARKKQDFTVATPGHLPQVMGNADYLERAVSNLMDNAIKYTRESGQVQVRATSDDGHVIVEVSDNGLGIPQEDLARIFERFYRVDRSRSREMGGTGLGLSIVKHVAQVHGGSIEVSSTPGEGSTFRLRIPAAARG